MNSTIQRGLPARLLLSLSIFCVFAGNAPHAAAQGVEPSGHIAAVAVNPHTPAHVFAAGADSVFRSFDGGRTWAESQDGPSAVSLVVLQVDGAADAESASMVFAATADRGVMRSTDGGRTWAADSGIGVPVDRVVAGLGGSTVWAGSEQALYRSPDRGATWDVVADDLGAGSVQGIAVDRTNPNNVYVAKWNRGVFISTDNGVTFAPGNDGLTDLQIYDLDIDPWNSAILYASTPTGLFRSADAGGSWSVVPGPVLVNAMTVGRFGSEYLYVATENDGLYRSRDDGTTWRTAAPNGVTAFTSLVTTVDTTEHVYAGSAADGLFISDNNGISWMTVAEFADTEPPSPSPPPAGFPVLTQRITDLQNGEAVSAGSAARFRITIRNEGPEIATDVVATAFWVRLRLVGDNDPKPFRITAVQGSCPTSSECRFGDMQPGEERVVEFSGETDPGGLTTYRIYARVKASNTPQLQTTAEIGSSVTVLSSEGGGGSAGLLALLAMVLPATRRLRRRPGPAGRRAG